MVQANCQANCQDEMTLVVGMQLTCMREGVINNTTTGSKKT